MRNFSLILYMRNKAFRRRARILAFSNALLLKEKHSYILGIRVSAVTETVVFIFILLLLDFLFGTGNRFQGVNPHPFWIIILLVTVQYGTIEGVVAAVFCTIALYLGNIPEIQFNESLFQYNARLATNPALWFVTALVLGEMHMRVINERDKFKEIALTSDRNAKEAADVYQLLKEKKEHLEVRLVSQVRSFSFSIKALQSMESLSPAQIFMSLVEMVREIIGPKKFSVYTFSESGFEVMLSQGWDDESYQRRFISTHPLYTNLVSQKHLLCVINPEDEAVLSGEGLIAAPIIDKESGSIYGMLKIEDMDFYDLNISNLWVIEALAELIGTAFSNAQKYHWLSKSAIYSGEEKGIYSYYQYKIQKNLLSRLFGELKVKFWELDVKFNKPEEDVESVQSELEFILQKMADQSAGVYKMGRDELHYSILLPNVAREKVKKMEGELTQYFSENSILQNCEWKMSRKEVEYAPSSK